jgi:hypothetical protein
LAFDLSFLGSYLLRYLWGDYRGEIVVEVLLILLSLIFFKFCVDFIDDNGVDDVW